MARSGESFFDLDALDLDLFAEGHKWNKDHEVVHASHAFSAKRKVGNLDDDSLPHDHRRSSD